MTKTIVFFLEEPSAREMLEGLLPRILPPDTMPRYIVFQGKKDLEKNLVKRLRSWLLPESVSPIQECQRHSRAVTRSERESRLLRFTR